MKGKKTFAQQEARRIRQLIRQKLVVDSSQQKQIRNEIRQLGFYITDFSNKRRYTVEDFDRYVIIQEG